MVLMTELTFLAIIPARFGSKGVPQKNIKPVAGKPLIDWTIEAALASELITEVVVSSESDVILNLARRPGVHGLKRPENLASDTASSELVVRHVIEQYSQMQRIFDYIVLLQPTSPARNALHINTAIVNLLNSKASSLISVVEPKHNLFKAFKLDSDGFLTGLVDNQSPFMRRQDLAKTFLANGAIYIVEWQKFIQNDRLMTERCHPFVMTEHDSIDIDTVEDIKKFESLVMSDEYVSTN